jgi:hypothetical protein
VRLGRLALLAVVLAILVASCGDDDTPDAVDDDTATTEADLSPEAEPFVDALVEDATNPDEPMDPPLPEEESRCLAERTVAIIGMDAIAESGASAQELGEADHLQDVGITISDAQIGELEDAYRACYGRGALDEPFAAAFGSDACDGTFDSDEFVHFATIDYARLEDAPEVAQSAAQFFRGLPGDCAELYLRSSLTGEDIGADLDCVMDELDGDTARAVLVASVEHGNAWTQEEPELFATVQAAITACQADG